MINIPIKQRYNSGMRKNDYDVNTIIKQKEKNLYLEQNEKIDFRTKIFSHFKEYEPEIILILDNKGEKNKKHYWTIWLVQA